MKPGTRVGAILDADEEKVRFLGYGVYQGDYVPEDPAITLFQVSMKRLQIKNPRILLDSGKEVWGCECWWGPEDRIRQSIGDRAVEIVDICNYRIPEDPHAVEIMNACKYEEDKSDQH